MGCILCRKESKTDAVAAVAGERREQYSWELTKGQIDPKDFTVEQLKDQLVVRKPGTINGQQFVIQDCQDCRILLLDHINAVTIDDCKNCQIVIGPTQGSVFIRNSENCRLVAACQQFRARDCLKLRISLLCSTQPCIEFCSGLKFSCIQLNYEGFKGTNQFEFWVEKFHADDLRDSAFTTVDLLDVIQSGQPLQQQIAKARLNPFTNFWYEVYDFTPSQIVRNWTYSKGYSKVFSEIESEELEGLEVSEDAVTSAVPRVQGTRNRTPNSHGKVLIFNGKDCEDKASKCLKILSQQGHHLVRSCRLEKNKAGANLDRILGEARVSRTCGPLVVLHLTGDELPDGVTQENHIHTSCDQRLVST